MDILTDLFSIFINSIAPILVIAGVGFLVGRLFSVDARSFGRVIFNAFSPALVFYSLATTPVDREELVQLSVVMLLVLLTLLFLAYLSTWQYHDNRVGRAGVLLSAICPNTGNLGLPLVSFVFGETALAYAVIAYILVTILINSVGVFVASSGHSSLGRALRNILRVPAIYAAVAGLLINTTGITLPLPIARSVSLLGQAAIPSMLILLGLELARSMKLVHPRLIGLSVGLRLLVAPIVAAFLVTLLGVRWEVGRVIILQASMPVAVVTLIVANEFKLNMQQQVGTVLTTTLLSPLTLSVLILLLQRGSG
ncbi:MAG: AEC family transporter [Anaerolineaceae bacterium]|nr:AEC family transporter [Anaerolineaceae bacterium]